MLDDMLDEMLHKIAPETLEDIDAVLREVGLDPERFAGLPWGTKLHVLAKAYTAYYGKD